MSDKKQNGTQGNAGKFNILRKEYYDNLGKSRDDLPKYDVKPTNSCKPYTPAPSKVSVRPRAEINEDGATVYADFKIGC